MSTTAKAPAKTTDVVAPSRRMKIFLRNLEGWLWISPWLLGLLLFVIGPMITSLIWSFSSYDIVNPARFIGIDNYLGMVDDYLVIKST